MRAEDPTNSAVSGCAPFPDRAIRALPRSCSYDQIEVLGQETTARRATRPSADATRGRILDAALDLFSELSFDGATTREIAARAAVTQPLLSYHFSSKDELWRAASMHCSSSSTGR
jgi:hypothetical protein